MRFFYVKNPQICQGCKTEMQHNELAVVLLMNIQGHKIPMAFHPQCYLEWNEKMFYHRLEQFQLGNNPRPKRVRKFKPKMGRPRLYTSPLYAYRLRASLRYHQNHGNEDKVKEIKESLEAITIKRGLTTEL